MTGDPMWPRLFVPRTGSTMDYARRLVASDCRPTRASAFWVLTAEQTRGRGTRGRRWAEVPGHAYLATLVIRRGGEADPGDSFPSTIALRVGAAIARAAEQVGVTPGEPAVKWPNDVLVAGRKAAGVLVEADPRRFFVGVGANVSAAPSRGAGGGDAQLGGSEIEPGCFGPSIGLYTFAERFEAVLAELLHGPEWWSVLQRRLAWRSQRVEVDSGDWKSVETRSGVVRGVAEDGALILEHDGRELRVHSGTIRQPEGSKSVDGAGDLFRG